jgi:hypothetical protein
MLANAQLEDHGCTLLLQLLDAKQYVNRSERHFAQLACTLECERAKSEQPHTCRKAGYGQEAYSAARPQTPLRKSPVGADETNTDAETTMQQGGRAKRRALRRCV